jgi:hypothetical protein
LCGGELNAFTLRLGLGFAKNTIDRSRTSLATAERFCIWQRSVADGKNDGDGCQPDKHGIFNAPGDLAAPGGWNCMRLVNGSAHLSRLKVRRR